MFGYEDYLGDLAMAVAGTSMLVVSLMGCLGAIWKNYIILEVYALCLSVFLLFEVIVGICLYTNPEKVAAIGRNEMFSQFHNYFVDSRSHYEVNEIQQNLCCCGINGPIYWIERNVTALPHSCCPDNHGQRVATSSCDKADAWQVGCLQKSIDMFRVKLCKITATTGSVNLIGMGYALYLRNSLKKENHQLP